MSNIKKRFITTMILHALGDTIGFKNGDWEFNYKKDNTTYLDLRIAIDLISEFIELGGVNGINLKNWNISDDTLFHEAVAKSLLEYENKLDENYINKIFKNNFIDTFNSIVEDNKNNIKRCMGETTISSIKKWTDNIDERKQEFNFISGGNGCAMRNLCIGLAFHDNVDKLIDYSIITSMTTHNNPLGFLGGLTSALFTNYAINNIEINNWIYELLIILNSKKVLKYIDTKNNDTYFAYREFIRYWEIYLDLRFLDNKPIFTKSNANILFRSKFYYDNFNKNLNDVIGSTGISAMIMAYDCLLDCNGYWEKLIVYAMLHSGDSDTVGAIAGGLYGAVYGYGDVPKHMLEYLEDKKKLEKYGEDLYSKFFSNKS